MITTLVRRAVPALLLAATPALTPLPATATTPAVPSASFTPRAALPDTAGSPTRTRVMLPLFEAVEQIPVAAEHRESYSRTFYKHWNKGLNGTDSCNTRKDANLTEAIEIPPVTAGCVLTGGPGSASTTTSW